MKKYILLLISVLAVIIPTGCSTQTAPGEDQSSASFAEPQKDYTVIYSLTEDEIIGNLSTSDYFWSHVSPMQYDNPAQAYTIKDLTINLHESTSENESFFITISAESPFAVYTGDFIVKFTGDKKNGYTLDLVYQDYRGTYEIIAPPTEELAAEWFQRLPPELYLWRFLERWPSETPAKAELLNTFVQELEGRNYLCEIQYDLSQQLDAHCTVNGLTFYYCEFENGIWNLPDKISRDPQITYIYDLPPVSLQEISSVVAGIIPDYIGTYAVDSGTTTVDSSDEFLMHISGCTLTSANFDTSQFKLNLDMRCQQYGDYRWELEQFSADGFLLFKSTDEISISDLANERYLSVKLSKLSYDPITELYFADVITVAPQGEPVNRIMELGTAGTGIKDVVYYLRDNSCYIYLNEDMEPVSFT